MRKLKVCNKLCDQCLFSSNRIVPASRANQIINESLQGDGHFECHKGTIVGQKIVCRGFWDRYKHDTLSLRAALIFDMYEFVEVPE